MEGGWRDGWVGWMDGRWVDGWEVGGWVSGWEGDGREMGGWEVDGDQAWTGDWISTKIIFPILPFKYLIDEFDVLMGVVHPHFELICCPSNGDWSYTGIVPTSFLSSPPLGCAGRTPAHHSLVSVGTCRLSFLEVPSPSPCFKGLFLGLWEWSTPRCAGTGGLVSASAGL